MEGTYSVEVREATKGGDDYQEEHHDDLTKEEAKEVIANLSEDEYVHSVLFYRAGTDCNPKDVTSKFK